MQFNIQNDRLHLRAVSRSMDAVNGAPVNIFEWSSLQKLLAQWLNVQVGTYTHFIGSFHVYERDFTIIDRVLDENTIQAISEECLPIDIAEERFDEELHCFFAAESAIRAGVTEVTMPNSCWLCDCLHLFHAYLLALKQDVNLALSIIANNVHNGALAAAATTYLRHKQNLN